MEENDLFAEETKETKVFEAVQINLQATQRSNVELYRVQPIRECISCISNGEKENVTNEPW
jgi:hypothetical protein